MRIENIFPSEIEKKSMEIIEREIVDVSHLSEIEKIILKRVIHTTADFDYCKNLKFSDGAAEAGMEALKNGSAIITDTNMALSGISKPALESFGCRKYCFMGDPDVAERAKSCGVTRAVASMEKASDIFGKENVIFAVGNAPTALIRIYELINEEKIRPSLVIGAPVGFVNVVQSKKLIMSGNAPYIVAEGRKGGSAVAAAICNALLYQIYDRERREN